MNMTKDFYILGEIVNATADRMSEEDLAPQVFKKFIYDLEKGDTLILHMNSVGGDCYAGMTIANMIKELNAKGVETVALVEGLAASIASVIACACERLQMYETSFLMVHKCWSIIQGNADDLKKQAEVMEQIDGAILSFYHKHFDLTDSELEMMMENETWIQGNEAGAFKLSCEVIPSERQYKVAACLRDKGFNKIPKGLIMEDKIEEVKAEETQPVEQEQKVEETNAAEAEANEEVEAVKEQVVVLLPETNDEVETVTKAEADKRVSGMQSTMQSKINALVKEHEAKVTEFQNQLKAKDEELTSVKAELTSLTQKLEDSAKELQATASALEEKTNALATLNANVNTPSEQTDWKALKGKAFFDWYKKTH